MIQASLHFVSQAPQSGQPVFITSWVEILSLVTLATLISGFTLIYKHFECHENGCRKLGKHPYGHLKLCRIHHPLVSGDSKKDIEEVTKSLV